MHCMTLWPVRHVTKYSSQRINTNSSAKHSNVQKTSPLSSVNIVNVQNSGHLPHTPSSDSYILYPRSIQPLKQNVQVFSPTKVFFFLFFIFWCFSIYSTLGSFSKQQESLWGLISLAVKNNVPCHARLSSRASFPCFPSYHFQGLLLSRPVWSE